MAVTAKMFTKALSSTFNKQANWTSDTIKAALATAYTFNQNTHQYFDAAPFSSAWTEVSAGGGYSTGGTTLTSPTITDSSTTWSYTASNATWSSATFTAAYCAVYDSTPGSNKPLLMYVDFGGNQTVSSGTFTVQWNASGIIQITVS